MKKTLLILLAAASLTQAADLKKAADAWQQSFTAESSRDYSTALKHVLDFKAQGGETYLAAVRAGWLCYRAGEHEKALTYYAAAAKQEPRSITPHLGLTYTYQAMQKPKETLSAARDGLNVDQYNFALLLIAGELLYNQKDYRKAETLFDRAHHQRPEDAIALSWLGWSRIAQGQAKLAAPNFEKLMLLNPNGYMVQQGYNISHGIPPQNLQASNRR